MDFVRTYGYGCVTKVHLISGSAFEISARFSSAASATESKYSGGVSVGTLLGAGSVAVNYAKNIASAESNATVVIESLSIPADTPTQAWTSGIFTALSSMAFSMLTEKVEGVLPYNGSAPTAPEFPKGQLSKKDEPDIKEANISDDVKRQMMANDKFEGTWEAYCAAKGKLFLKVNNAVTVKDASTIIKSVQLHNIPVDAVLSEPQALEVSELAGKWDFGGYIPHDFEFTMWHDIFPQLNKITSRIPLTTLSTMQLAQAYVFYTAQLQFSSYLSLLIDISRDPGGPSIVGRTAVLQADLSMFNSICDKVQKHIESKASNSAFMRSDFEEIVSAFGVNLRNAETTDFSSRRTYDEFMEHYEFYNENLMGFAVQLVDKNGSFRYPTLDYRYSGRSSTPHRVTELMQKSIRMYAVQNTRRKGDFTLYSMSYGNWVNNFVASYRPADTANILTDVNGNKYYRINTSMDPILVREDIYEVRVYGAGIEMLEILKNIPDATMSGVPMISPIDNMFNSLLEIAEETE